MARIRSIKPSFFTSLTIADLTAEQRLTFIGLWTHVDDHGRCIADPRLVKAAVWPLDDRSPEDVGKDLEALRRLLLVTVYEVGGRRYLEVAGWAEHQRVSHPKDSEFPAPDFHEPAVKRAPIPPLTSDNADAPEGSGSFREASGGLPPHARVRAPAEVEVEVEVEVEGVKPLSTAVDARPTDDESFELFWERWPRRNGKRIGKDKAQRSWARLSLPDRRAAYVGAGHYAAASDAGLAGAKDAFRWLQGREWGDWQTAAQPDGQHGADPPAGKPRLQPWIAKDAAPGADWEPHPTGGWTLLMADGTNMYRAAS